MNGEHVTLPNLVLARRRDETDETRDKAMGLEHDMGRAGAARAKASRTEGHDGRRNKRCWRRACYSPPPMLHVRFLPVVVALVAGCDSRPAPTTAKAEEKKADDDLDKRLAERKAKREAAEKAKVEAEAKKAADVDALCVLPAKLPKKLDKGCADVAAAHDRFMNRSFEGEVREKWNAAKGTQMPMTIMQCTNTGSLQVAGCQAAALDKAPPEMASELPTILKRCIDKFANATGRGAGAAPTLPKKPR